MRILLVEDDQLLGKKITEYLEENNHRVTWHTGSIRALNALYDIRYDAIITDMQMPKGNGIEMLQGIWVTPPNTPPTCVHSSENTFRFHGKVWDLPTEILEFFSFAEFHNKRDENWREYIPLFLAKIN